MSHSLAALLAGVAPLLGTSSAQDWLPADLDGRLEADAFASLDDDAADQLRRGDQALALARASADPSVRTRQRVVCFEAWRGALDAAPGQLVRFTSAPPASGVAADSDADEPTGPGWGERLYEGLEESVLRRIGWLSEDERAERRERLGPLSRAAAQDAYVDIGALAAVERAHPGLEGALAAALRLGDIALESGRTSAALGWYERAARHARLGATPGGEPERPIARSIEGRIEAGRGLRSTSAETRAAGGWEGARGLELEGVLPLLPNTRTLTPPRSSFGRSIRSGPAPAAALGGGLRSGLAFLADGRTAVQGPNYLTFADPPERSSVNTVDWTKWLSEALPGNDGLSRTWSRREAPGWALTPVGLGSDVALVFGRGNNLLTVVSAPPAGGFERPRMRWATDGYVVVRATAAGTSVQQLDLRSQGDGLEFEFQTGGVRVGEALVVEARELGDGVRSILMAFDVRSGDMLWSRFLARGSDRVPEVSFGAGFERALPAAGQALTAIGSRVFVGTHLGLGFLVDAIDGRILWGLSARRREPDERGWTGGRPVVVPADEAGVDPQLLWSPADSDYLYRLRAGVSALVDGPWTSAPLALDGHAALLGGGARSLLLLARSGARRALRAVDVTTGARLDALHFGPGERGSTHASTSSGRVLYLTERGLYLFDSTRDLYLLDRRTLAEEPLPGFRADLERASLHVRGERALVLAGDVLFVFRATR